MKDLVTPRVNLNGTDAEVLIDGRVLAMRALATAIDAMAQSTPHGRDYTIGGSIVEAQAAWRERIAMLNDLRHELERDAIAIQEQTR